MMMPMDTTKPSRKMIRLDGYDYSSSGAYFITICTVDRKPLLWKCPDADFGLSHCGETVKTAIESIRKHYECVAVDKYCIMPNHVHLILTITADERGRMISAPTVSNVVGSMKRWVSKELGVSIWQKSFFDRVIRGEKDYLEIWQYIDENPLKWVSDELYIG